jgi:hypothetical protein
MLQVPQASGSSLENPHSLKLRRTSDWNKPMHDENWALTGIEDKSIATPVHPAQVIHDQWNGGVSELTESLIVNKLLMSLSSAETGMGLTHISRIKMQKPSDPIALIVICMKKGKVSSCKRNTTLFIKKRPGKKT